MTDKSKKYLSDVLRAIELIELFTNDVVSFEAYQADLKTKSAVERQLSIIGEAVNQFRKEDTEHDITHAIQIVGLRNRLIHAYDSTEDTVIWAIIKRHLQNLKTEVSELLAQ